MGNIPGTNVKIWMAQYDLSGYSNKVGTSHSCKILKCSTFGCTSQRKTPGTKNWTMTAVGYWDFAETDAQPDKAIHSNLLAESNKPLTLGPEGYDAGDAAALGRLILGEYKVDLNLDEVIAFSISAEGSGDLINGRILERHAFSSPGSEDGPALELGPIAAGKTMYAALHGFLLNATSLAVKIESDDAEAFTTPTDRIIFTTLTDEGSEWKTLAGPIADTWWRVSATVTGGAGIATYGVSAGIQ